MSDDQFIREVNEEFRKDQARLLWERWGVWIIGAAAAIIIATAAWVGWNYWTDLRAKRSGDAFSDALALANSGEEESALAAFGELEQNGFGDYPLLARMRAATILAERGDADEAVSEFDAVAADRSAPGAIRDMARLRAALLLVDHGSYADVASRVEPLTAEGNALRHSAREALGLAAWKEGRLEDAGTLFGQIYDDDQAPANIRQRANLMSELIRGAGAGGDAEAATEQSDG
ncbi:MAG: tetratricopeptide repeat protein [Rhizobiaceae bacterium]|nr:tetratricopeptide repeat protein [Rhizobiaceae bacterium]MCV0407319.1 tetratricopeptide repeat protein [Rhizobiaceae bacterium]